jgi:hypothetical protein
MVAIYQIINENVLAFELDAGDRALWNGIRAEWRGASFIAQNTNSQYPDIRRNQPIPKSYRGAFVNAAREAKGLPRLNFDGGGNLRTGPTTPPAAADTNTTPAAPRAQKPPLELDDLSRGDQRRLNRTGTIQFGGHTYTKAEIQAFTQQAAARRAQAGRDARSTMFNAQTKDDIIKNKSFLAGATARTMRGILPGFGLSVGVQAGAWLALRELLLDIQETAWQTIDADGKLPTPTLSDDDITDLLTKTNLLSQRVLGLWFALTAAPEILGAAVRGTAGVISVIKNRARIGNAISMAFQQAASAFTGPGFLVMLGKNALQWALVEGGLAALTFIVVRSAYVQEWVLQIIKNEWTGWIADQGFRGASETNKAIENAWNYVAADKLDVTDEITEVDIMKRLYLDSPNLAVGLMNDNPELVNQLPAEVQSAMRGVFRADPNTSVGTAPETVPKANPTGVVPDPFN